jgi:Gram-negative porin
MKRIPMKGNLGSVLLILLGATSAAAQTFENQTGGSVRFYGQTSPSYLSFDDGEISTGNLVDNANSNTRLGFVIEQPAWGGDLVLTFETALGFVQSSEVSQTVTPSALAWERTDLRKFEAAYAGGFGKLSIGQGSMATDGVATLDASGTGIVGSVTVPDVAGAFAFREDTGGLSDVTISDAYKDFDGSRRFRVRYDTPEYSGFSVAVAYGRNILSEDDDKDYYDIGMVWSGTAGDFELAAAVGYAWEDGDRTTERYAGSFSMLHAPTGLNLSLSAGGDPDGGTYGYAKAGWKGDLIAPGPSAFSVDYYDGNDLATDDSSSSAFGLSAVQSFTDLDLEMYLGYRAYSYDDTASYQEADSFLFGARYKF